jgi:hypothetical protein
LRDVEVLTSSYVEWLVGTDRKQHHRRTMGERADDAARAGVRHDEFAMWKEQRLRDITLDTDVRGLGASQTARISSSMSSSRSGVRSPLVTRVRPPVSKLLNPACSITESIPGWPPATRWPARSAARASGTRGRKCPVPPANVNSILCTY